MKRDRKFPVIDTVLPDFFCHDFLNERFRGSKEKLSLISNMCEVLH